MGPFAPADAKGDGRDIPAERDIGIGTAGTECGLQPGPFPDGRDPVMDFVMLHSFTAGPFSQEQGFDFHIRPLMGLQDGLESGIQLFQFRMGNGPHVHGEFHLRRNGIDGGPSLDGPHIVGGFGIFRHLEIVKVPDDPRRFADGVGRSESGIAVAPGRNHMDRVPPGPYGQVHEPVTVPVHRHEVTKPVSEGIGQGPAPLQIPQAFLPHIEGKDRRSPELQGQHHPDQEQQGRHIGTVVSAGRGLQGMAVDFRHDFLHPCKHRIHMGGVQGELFHALDTIRKNDVPGFILAGSFRPHGLQLVQDPPGLFPFFSGGRRNGDHIIQGLDVFRHPVVDIVLHHFAQHIIHGHGSFHF